MSKNIIQVVLIALVNLLFTGCFGLIVSPITENKATKDRNKNNKINSYDMRAYFYRQINQYNVSKLKDR